MWQNNNWRQLPGSAIDCAWGPEGSLYIVGTDKQIYQWNDDQSTWNKFSSWSTPALRISADKAGRPWVVGTNGNIARWLGNQWQNLDGGAIDVGHSVDGSAWVVGTNNQAFRWSFNQNKFISFSGTGLRDITVDNNGIVWATTTSNTLQRLSTRRWKTLPGAADSIGTGVDGSTYIVGKDATPGGNGVWRYLFEAANWDKISNYHGAVAVAVDKDGNPIIVDDTQTIWSWNADKSSFVKLSDGANDIASGADGSIWIIGVQSVGGGFNIRQWNPTTKKFQTISGGAVRIGVAPNGNPWVVNSNNDIFSWDGSNWTQQPGKALDIGCAVDGTVYIVGTDNTLQKWIPTTRQWATLDLAGIVQVTGDKYGNAWAVSSKSEIITVADDAANWKWPADRILEEATPASAKIPPSTDTKKDYLEQLPGSALDVGVSPEGNVWIIGSDQGIYGWNEAKYTWERVSGGAVRIAVGPKNEPWVVNSGNGIYQYLGNNNWKQTSGAAIDIGVGADGSVWAVGTDNNLYTYNREENSWKRNKHPVGALRVSVDADGNPWVTDKNNNIWRWADNDWQKLSGAATDIGVGADGTVKVIGTDGNQWHYIGSSNSWLKESDIPNNGVSIAVDPSGDFWATDKAKNIWRASGIHDVTLSGAAVDVAVGGDNSLWVVGTDSIRGGGGVFRYQAGSDSWTRISNYHGAARITADPAGNPWIVDANNYIYRWDSNSATFVKLPDAANDISVSANGKVWIIGIAAVGGGYDIRYWNADKNAWTTIPGGAVRICADPKGNPWVINSNNDIFYWSGSWAQIGGKGFDIGCGADGSVWLVGTDNNLYDRNFQTGSWI